MKIIIIVVSLILCIGVVVGGTMYALLKKKNLASASGISKSVDINTKILSPVIQKDIFEIIPRSLIISSDSGKIPDVQAKSFTIPFTQGKVTTSQFRILGVARNVFTTIFTLVENVSYFIIINLSADNGGNVNPIVAIATHASQTSGANLVVLSGKDKIMLNGADIQVSGLGYCTMLVATYNGLDIIPSSGIIPYDFGKISGTQANSFTVPFKYGNLITSQYRISGLVKDIFTPIFTLAENIAYYIIINLSTENGGKYLNPVIAIATRTHQTDTNNLVVLSGKENIRLNGSDVQINTPNNSGFCTMLVATYNGG